MNYTYLLTPFLAAFAAGLLKYIFTSLRARRWTTAAIGASGIPSNHSAIVSSMAMLIALKEGVTHPAFGVAITLALIVILDTYFFRREIDKHAVTINHLAIQDILHVPLREHVRHTRTEIFVGILVGMIVGFLMA